MAKKKDWTGQIQGGLEVLREVGKDERGYLWLCRCSCGVEEVKYSDRLHQGCYGCTACSKTRKYEKISDANTGKNVKHGATIGARKGRRDPVYVIWQAIKQRCSNPHRSGHEYYEARGIQICEEWASSFEAFRDYVGPRPTSRHSIDRYPDVNGNYEPGNVRWATPTQQSINRRNTIRVSHKGEIKSLYEWAAEYGLSFRMLQKRYRSGWRGEELFKEKGFKRLK